MSKKYIYEEKDSCAIITAIEDDADQKTKSQDSPNIPPAGVPEDSVPSTCEALAPVCPNPDEGFQPLSKYWVDLIAKKAMWSMKKICRQRGVSLDCNYWYCVTREILAAPSTEEATIVPAPAGAGKSTWILAFTATFVSLLLSEPELAVSLVGVVVVLQKVEDLNRLAEVLNSDSPQDGPNMVALQGWSSSGQRRGFCQNPAVQRFEECVPSTCPKAAACELRAFQSQAFTAPIVGLTQERFDMLRGSGGLNKVLYRLDGGGRLRPRRYIIFDEKFPMAQVYTLDKNTIDRASLEMTKLIERRSTPDSHVKSLQQQLSISISRPFQKLRGDLRVSIEVGIYSGKLDIQAGTCSFDGANTGPDSSYKRFRTYVIDEKPQYASKLLREAIAVMDALYDGKQCLFSKTNGFAVSHILPPSLQFGQSQAIVFDATAQIDEDYSSLDHVRFLSGTPRREKCHVEFHIFTHRDLNVSKSAMNAPWKLLAFSQLICDFSTPGDMFICTYKNQAEALAEALEEALPPEKFKHILMMENREHPTIPYLGGTNGSNQFHTATQVFMLGYPRLNPRDYLIHTGAAYGTDRLFRELEGISPEQLTSKDLDILYTLPSMRTYIAHHLAARLEQEIYRCALRNPGFTGKIKIYLFCPPDDVMNVLLDRIPGEVIVHKELPSYVAVCKSTARRYEDGNTSFGRLALFLESWDGAPIAVSVLRDQLNISSAVWKDLMADERVRHLFEQYGVERSGRGRSVELRISKGNCA